MHQVLSGSPQRQSITSGIIFEPALITASERDLEIERLQKELRQSRIKAEIVDIQFKQTKQEPV